MPLIPSSYKRPWYFPNAHMETIVPSLYYKVDGVYFERERLELSDGDFLDLDWIKQGSKKLIVLSHGLEGSSDRHYIKRPAKLFSSLGWDILAWNNRSCSGEMNRLPRFYHHGATEDIAAVIDHALKEDYEELILIGYSMGGGMQQKYLGERPINERIKGAISFSVPCNLHDGAASLQIGISKMYEHRFIKKLKEKIIEKSAFLDLDIEGIDEIKTFRAFDKKYTLRMFPGYKDTNDFYNKISSDQYLPNIDIPLLIVNSKNDPMLIGRCYPVDLAEKSKTVYLEMPEKGGHVGFTLSRNEYSYMEFAAKKFIEEVITT